jgi:hypothetical protein
VEITASFFKQRVRHEATIGEVKVQMEVADMISDVFVSRDQTTYEHVNTAVAVAKSVAEWAKLSGKKATRAALADLVLGLTTPEAVLSCRQREEAVRPAVEQLRLDYFRATTVPFLSYEKAVEWLRQQAVVRRTLNHKQMLRLVTDVTKAMQRFPKDFDLEFNMGSHAILLLTPKSGALKGEVGFDKGSALEKLKQVTEEMSAGTGCDTALCVAHVLTGTPLLLRPLHWSIEFSHGCGINRRSARIDVLQPHAVTLPVLAQGFRSIRKELGLAKKKTMAGRHERLLRLIDKCGGVPRQSKTEFWQDVRRAWNKAVPKGEHPYETWRGPLMAYRRLQKALNKR